MKKKLEGAYEMVALISSVVLFGVCVVTSHVVEMIKSAIWEEENDLH